MSINLDFWKYKKGQKVDYELVYQKACCDGEALDELEELPVQDILQRTEEVFADWVEIDPENYEKEGHGAFSIYTTPQIIRFDCYDMSGDDMSRMINIMREFNCPLYDPQLGERFDHTGEFLARYGIEDESQISR